MGCLLTAVVVLVAAAGVVALVRRLNQPGGLPDVIDEVRKMGEK